MTKFEKKLEPIEQWIRKKLQNRIPYSEEIDVPLCAAFVLQYAEDMKSNQKNIKTTRLKDLNSLNILIENCISSGKFIDVSNYLPNIKNEDILQVEDILNRYNDITATRKLKALFKAIKLN